MKKGGEHYQRMQEHYNFIREDEEFSLIESCVDNGAIEKAYEIAGKKSDQMPRELTLYYLKEHEEGFHFNPLNHLNYVPESYLFEAVDEDLCVYVHDGIEEIKDWAFAFCRIKKLIISNKVKYIGDGALLLNGGEIEYEGTKQEFISNFMGATKCFMRTFSGKTKGRFYPRTINCKDGALIP